MSRIGKYFTLKELTVTHENMDNTPGINACKNLNTMVKNLLDPVRETIGEPIKITSGYRSLAVNRAVGGSMKPISQHTKGEAADMKCSDNARLFRVIRDHFDFDQLIWEKGNDVQPEWVHVSYKAIGNRNHVLKYKNGKYIQL
ncbi:MAG: D-Ala-D-Ala carboxypeptidase family metallohydrolase [Paludibacter sp.]